MRTPGVRGVATRGEGTEFGRVIAGDGCALDAVAGVLTIPDEGRNAADAEDVLRARVADGSAS